MNDFKDPSGCLPHYGRSPLHDTLLLPDGTQLPARKYLDWHRTSIFAT